MISKDEADDLHEAPKIIYENIEWEWDGQKYVATARVECKHRDDILRLVGWKNSRRYSFSLLYRNAITIRRWGDHPGHKNPDNEPIDGAHKHYYKEGHEADWAYETNDVSTSDVRRAFFDFLEEESIELGGSAAYQDTLGQSDE